MSENGKRKLNFTRAAGEVLIQANAMHTLFTHHQAGFFAFSPRFTVAWGEAFEASIEAAQAVKTPDEYRAQVKILTRELNKARETALAALQRLFAFVQLAFEDDPARLQSFGASRYRQSINNLGHLVQLLKLAHTQALANSAALEAAGYTAAQIAALETLTDALEAAKTAQMNAQSAQKVGVDAYFDALNAVWGYMRALARVRQFVFPDNPEKQALFLLYPKGYRKHKRHKTVVEGNGEVVGREGELQEKG